MANARRVALGPSRDPRAVNEKRWRIAAGPNHTRNFAQAAKAARTDSPRGTKRDLSNFDSRTVRTPPTMSFADVE